jgi:cyclopropane fatty-acyl-phospholipid synthase-like methyltransferase
MWNEMGALQIAFLQARGLKPYHRLVDIGCGALRGGIPIARYLDVGHYYGLDINASLIEAGRRELAEEGLEGRDVNLIVDGRFDLGAFRTTFDWAIAISLFTHLPMNNIVRCLVETRKVLAPHATLFATYFEAPAPAFLDPLTHTPGDMVTHYDVDPYHYAFEEFRMMAAIAGLRVEHIGPWGHPRDQRMLAFYREG